MKANIEETRLISKELIEIYVASCGCESGLEIAGVLHGLITLAAMGMVAAEDKESAIKRLESLINYIKRADVNHDEDRASWIKPTDTTQRTH